MTPAIDAVRAAGVEHLIRSYDPDDLDPELGLGEAVASVLELDPAAMAKTLVATPPRGEPIVAVVPVRARLDLKAAARATGHKKLEMADPAVAERRTGYVTGGISPFGQRRRHQTVVDRSALDHEWCWVSGGRRGLELGVRPDDLVRLLDATVAEITAP